jgi:hypothetical protein
MKILFLALVAAAASAGQPFARESAIVNTRAPGFALLPAAKCDEAHDVGHCLVARPKEWSADERLVIQQTMRALTAHELVQGILVGAQENGYTGFRRYSTDTKPDPRYGRAPKFSPGFVLYPSKVIGITDAFFQTADMADPVSGYRFGDLILVHELIHAFDDRRWSTDVGFTSVSGWVFRNDRWEYAHPISVSGYNAAFAESLTLYGRGRYGEARTRDRSFATSLTFPLPTLQSLATPGESFADLLAHLIVDRRAATYLHADVVAWFERNVFPVLLDKARRFRAADLDLF